MCIRDSFLLIRTGRNILRTYQCRNACILMDSHLALSMLDTNDRVKVGSGTPKVSLGFNINLTYKDFDLVANFYGDFGAKRYNYTKYQLERMDHV